jgi:TonB family protein
MREGTGTPDTAETAQPARELQLLVAPDSWPRNFLENLRELFRPGEVLSSRGESPAEADFWPDVFVCSGLPWLRFLQSGMYHVLVILLIWAGSRFLALQPRAVSLTPITHAEVVYYTPAEYLPPIDTRPRHTASAKRADPEVSAQPIISVPREADNRKQTVVAPPKVKLREDVALPNVVSWREKTQVPIAPAPAVMASEISRLAPRVEQSVIAPPPDVRDKARDVKGPPMAVIAPPPSVDADARRRMGDLEIGRSAVIAPAPQLSLDAQRAGRNPAQLSAGAAQVIAPPPSVRGSQGPRSQRSMIALSLHPAVSAPVAPAAGNRRGSFATAPGGHAGASGGAGDANGKGSGSGAKGASSADLPAGLYVGKSAKAPSAASGGNAAGRTDRYEVNPKLLASARPPRVSSRMLKPEVDSKLADEERAVFGNRKFYSLSLNMPNLNSAGGSWVIRFAALQDAKPSDSGSAARAADANATGQDLSAPSATRKVDPAYPLELMRQNVGGTVILYAVIRSDGSVGKIRVLRGVDERLDRYASDAIAKWKFDPATKNGAPVDVEATFWIPFKPSRTGSGF